MRVAVLADVHGNLPALHAVLAELDEERVDALVIAGDVVGGPYARATLDLLSARREPITWIRGNSEREAVAAWDGEPAAEDEAGAAAAWTAASLDRHWRDELASWPLTAALDGVLFCHGSPRRDDEVLTRQTPDAALRDALRDVRERVVVGGHTHQQMVRRLDGAPTFINAGSVGIPYEGRPGAFWLIIDGGRPTMRETSYPIEPALEELRASGFPDVESLIRESLLEPIDPRAVAEYFEHLAGRGPAPELNADGPPGG